MSALTQEEVPTLSALKAAAHHYLNLPDTSWYAYSRELARAEFWRLAFKWRDQRGAPIVSSGRDETGQEARDAIRDDREADAIISEVESRA